MPMMKRILLKTAVSGAVLLSTVVATAITIAGPSGGDFEIINSTIDNGGGVSAGGNFKLTGTIGQVDANASISSGGDFQLAGGFWARISELIFADGFEDN